MICDISAMFHAISLSEISEIKPATQSTILSFNNVSNLFLTAPAVGKVIINFSSIWIRDFLLF